MIIKCWGARGSIPVSGEKYVKYGGDTACIEIRTKSDDIIIIDAGTGIRRLGNQVVKENRFQYHMIFTHAHWDHIMGFPFFRPVYMENAELRMYRCPFASKFVETVLSRVMAAPFFPVKFGEITASIVYEEACPDAFEIGSVRIVPISLSHPNGGSGYKFIEDGKSFVYLTDNELGFVHPGGRSFDDYLEFSSGADFLIHDAEYTPEEYRATKSWGHSVYTDAIELAMGAGVKKVGLFHLNQDRTDKAMDQIAETCREQIMTNGHEIECIAVGSDMTFYLA
jgi:phosphoribosyl 1,2-cyclic phosphodiesterase